MSMIQSDLLLGQEGGAGYVVQRSLRFSSIDSAYLSRTPSSSGNRRTWTWAGWVKRSALGSNNYLFTTTFANANAAGYLYFNASNSLTYWDRRASADGIILVTNSVFRDVSAWYHVVLSVDYSNATAANRARLYVNGVEQTYSSNSYPNTTEDSYFNAATAHYISSTSGFIDGYLADVYFIDGQALDPSSFVAVSATTGRLEPKQYAGSFGTNGFWLKFSDNSAAIATTLGKDYSGNNNNWSCNNLSVFSGALGTIYTPPSGFSVWSDVFDTGTGSITYSNSNKTATATNTSEKTVRTATAKSTGKWYIEFVRGVVGNSADEFWGLVTSTSAFPGNTGSGGVGWAISRAIYNNWGSGTSETISAAAYSSGSVVQLAVDFTAKKLWWGIDNNWLSGDPSTGTTPSFYGWSGTPSWYAAQRLYYNASSATINEGPAAVLRNNDSTVDTPTSAGTDTGLGGQVTGNYCTLNPLAANTSLSNGNLEASGGGSGDVFGTIGVTSGKWYYEGVVTANTDNAYFGFRNLDNSASSLRGYRQNGQYFNGSSWAAYGATYGVNDIIGVALNLDGQTIEFFKNGVSQGQKTSIGLNVLVFPNSNLNSTEKVAYNFGQRQWVYAAPAGFKALCDTNLPAPVVAKSSDYFQTLLWTGNGVSGRSITGLSFNPDLVWIKQRSTSAGWHVFFDSIRQGGQLASNVTDAELAQGSNVGGYVSAYTSNGFTMTAGSSGMTSMNANNESYVAWCFDAGSNTVSNTAGSITSQVRANASAGFSIVTWTGNGTAASVGTGLNVPADFVILKNRFNTTYGYWKVYHKNFTSTYNGELNTTIAPRAYGGGYVYSSTNGLIQFATSANYNEVNINGDSYVAYCFSPVAGYASAFSFTGNGSTDGPAVWLGFRPKLLIVKRTDTTGNWTMKDSSRSTYNVNNLNLFSNLSNAETTEYEVDFLSNGFKVRNTWSDWNANGGTYVGFAWAESPFQYARAR